MQECRQSTEEVARHHGASGAPPRHRFLSLPHSLSFLHSCSISSLSLAIFQTLSLSRSITLVLSLEKSLSLYLAHALSLSPQLNLHFRVRESSQGERCHAARKVVTTKVYGFRFAGIR